VAVNFKLTKRPALDPVEDAMGRSWVGWDSRRSDEELWSNNRGVWALRATIMNDEDLATLSFEGVIQVVARITGTERITHPSFSRGYKTALVGDVLPPGDPVRDALVGRPVDQDRNPVTYIDTSDVEGLVEEPGVTADATEPWTFLLTHNPIRWLWDPMERTEEVAATAGGRQVKGQWATGNRVHDMKPGHRVFLLQQGDGIRGVTASGYVDSPVFQGLHWDDSGRLANYVLVRWDVVLEEEDALLTEELHSQIPSYSWRPQSSGEALGSEVAEELEALWESHLESILGGQGWWSDPARRVQVEDHAQTMLEEHYRAQGWDVEDTRQGNPYDAIATQGDKVLYLEAKGTQRNGAHVLVTAGEVEWARSHECVIGIVSNIRFHPNGDIDITSGSLRVYPWSAPEGELTPTQYRWTPSTD
jgi:hypothetical protein